ncbi:MAG: hypothetical protein U1A78_32130 [Polyangia bacterium]
MRTEPMVGQVCEPPSAAELPLTRTAAAPAPPVPAEDHSPPLETGAYFALLAAALVLAVVLNSSGCATSLPVHERMGALSRAARRAANEGRVAREAALGCAKAARDAGAAIQDARKALAGGAEEPELTARAVALPRAAEEACKRAGITPEVR